MNRDESRSTHPSSSNSDAEDAIEDFHRQLELLPIVAGVDDLDPDPIPGDRPTQPEIVPGAGAESSESVRRHGWDRVANVLGYVAAFLLMCLVYAIILWCIVLIYRQIT